MNKLDKKNNIIEDQRGVAALITVLVMLALVLSLGLAISKLSVNELSLDLEALEAQRAIQIANSCVDEAQFRLKRNPSYTGGTLTFTDGSCTATVTGGGFSRTVTIQATVRNLTRNLTVDVNLTANSALTADGTEITNWDEN